MAIKMINKRYCTQADGDKYVCEFICDTEDDAANLQTEHPECSTGSTAVVCNTGDVYVVNASGQWVKFGGE